MAVFPTGGGKSITFQIPALMSGENVKGLTVVISPLQSLMKDQVDNLDKKNISEAVYINGLLDPIERTKAFEKVRDGMASILYLSPESLRSRTIEKLLLGRNIVRFVIDEAHCFSSWGQDFRVDYLYIGKFIKSFQEKINAKGTIPISCFTATAKLKVIEDIRNYFRDVLSLDLEVFSSKTFRTNLHYKVFKEKSETEKYREVKALLEGKKCPTIIYVSRTRTADELAARLSSEGFSTKAYHGKMDKEKKKENQEAFIRGEVDIMAATSAFGMGVDKDNVGMVIHYEISNSLENYIQEAGRAGRNENITADCYILFNEDDLNKHFFLLNQTRIGKEEINQIWKAVKEFTSDSRSEFSNSALEIARKAGWEPIPEIETKVKTAINALEEAGYLKRGQNIPNVYADSILVRNTVEAVEKIQHSERFSEEQKKEASGIISRLFSAKSKGQSKETGLDFIALESGLKIQKAVELVGLLKEEKILGEMQDLIAFVKGTSKKTKDDLRKFRRIEELLLKEFSENEEIFSLKKIKEDAEENGFETELIDMQAIIKIWAELKWIQKKKHSKDHIAVKLFYSGQKIREKLDQKNHLTEFIIEYIYKKLSDENSEKKEGCVEFSLGELKEGFNNRESLFKKTVAEIKNVEDSIFYLQRIGVISIEGGFLVIYNKLKIERIEKNNRIEYKEDDYKKLFEFYEDKIRQIHIAGEYAEKMSEDSKSALKYVEDYFNIDYDLFLKKYFSGNRKKEIEKSLTSGKYKEIFGDLSEQQKKIIDDRGSNLIAVAAGPGSGKTKLLVHKLASLLLLENVKTDQLLMLTFSRAAVTEFSKRLHVLIGKPANSIQIRTFHSYCFEILGKIGSREDADGIIKKAVNKIREGNIETKGITKTVLVIDEAQDMDADEYSLIKVLKEKNENMKVIAVGDDDQNIYEFRGADSKYLKNFIDENDAVKYELTENYRSKRNLVEFTNQFAERISSRLKETPIAAVQSDNGKIKIMQYSSSNLIIPIVKDIAAANLTGTTCILTNTNDEALQITGFLLKNGIQAKLIQTDDGFNLYNLQEIRFFLDQFRENMVISDEDWINAKRHLVSRFKRSSKLDLCKTVIKTFERSSQKVKYRSDLEIFIRESRMEDFYFSDEKTILVSTIHKAKGKEFDNVIILLEDFIPNTDEKKRLLYVGMTRAKNRLNIHYNGNYFENMNADSLERIYDKNKYSFPDFLSLHLTHEEVNLGYFAYTQKRIQSLMSGDFLTEKEEGCADRNGEQVLKFSKKFKEKLNGLKSDGFQIQKASVRFIVYWESMETKKEIKIVLPELILERKEVRQLKAFT